MKNYLRAALVFIAIGAFVALALLSALPASAHNLAACTATGTARV